MNTRIVAQLGRTIYVGRWEKKSVEQQACFLRDIQFKRAKNHRFILGNGESLYLTPYFVMNAKLQVQRTQEAA